MLIFGGSDDVIQRKGPHNISLSPFVLLFVGCVVTPVFVPWFSNMFVFVKSMGCKMITVYL